MTEPPATVGRYHVTRLIAHGGMGSLYLARDPVIDRLVAIKLLKEGFDDAQARERFAREARAAGRLHHPNIVTIFDVGEHADRPFIAMEYVAGETLAQLIARGALRRLSEKLAIVEVLCAALEYAHQATIVHRDIKPANVMLDEAGVLKVLDFGIARGGGLEATRIGEVVGTLNYMSPEQLSGREVDHRTDIYSVGVLAYELLTGNMAFPGAVDTGVLYRILNSAPSPIKSRVPLIDPDIPAIIEHAMEKDPDARYQNLEDMRRDLADVRARLIDRGEEIEDEPGANAETRFYGPLSGSGVPRLSDRPSGRLLSGPQTDASRSGARAQHTSGARRIVLAGVALALGALAVTWLGTRSPADAPAAPETVAREAPPPSPPGPPPTAAPPEPDANKPPGDDELRALRATARQQIVAGERTAALTTLTRALALNGADPEINSLLDDVARVARRTTTEARAAAARRGADGSDAFRAAEAREHEADVLLRAGDRARAVRAFWAAAAAYNALPGVARRTDAATPSNASSVAARPSAPGDTAEPRIPAPTDAPVPATPAPLPSKAPPAQTAAPAPLPPQLKPEPPGAAARAQTDPVAEASKAIAATLRRYRAAYESLDSAAVGAIMPSLTSEQLRNLARDFANYRSYVVEIRDERIAVEGSVATVTCQIVRSFETKNGVAGSNTVDTVFHLRRVGSAWVIARLESR